MDRPLSISFDVFNEESENTKGDIKSSSSGISAGFGLKNNLWYQRLKYNYYSSETTTSSTSTANSITGEEGLEIITSSMTFRLSQDTRDNYINPKSGHLISFANTLAGFGGDSKFIKSVLKSKILFPINYGNYTLGLKSEAKKYAILLGYNYQYCEWYEKSYSLFDKMYLKNKKNNFKKENKKSDIILKRFKSLFE